MVLPKEEAPETQRLWNRIAQRVGDSILEHQIPKLQKEGRSARKLNLSEHEVRILAIVFTRDNSPETSSQVYSRAHLSEPLVMLVLLSCQCHVPVGPSILSLAI